jgi:uncharacterized protein YdeI (YjbR/CyaY-like superfamily)
MGTKDPRVDAYIAKAAPFARPILEELRSRLHASCPGVVENIKWGAPAFEYEGPLAGMAAFKAHAAFGFWKHELIVQDDVKATEAMGSFGRLTSVSDLPPKSTFARYAKLAMKLNAEGIKAPRRKTAARPEAPMHPDFEVALAKNAKAKSHYEAMAPSHQREYREWIGEAKRGETRARRIDQAIEWLAQGKPRNWKYMKR